ncbi:MAG: hypothetical protein ACXWIN_01830 [Burkholderiaceae bacterium]
MDKVIFFSGMVRYLSSADASSGVLCKSLMLRVQKIIFLFFGESHKQLGAYFFGEKMVHSANENGFFGDGKILAKYP